jgi:propanol-preferring alcohol dehydrogenase
MTATMTTMVAGGAGEALRAEARPLPQPRGAEVLLRIEACGVCRTDLHLLDGELPQARYPVVPGHQAVGRVIAAGPQAVLAERARVGAAWLAWTCGECEFCVSGRENLCDNAEFHGCHRDGGFATHMLADSRWCIPIDAAAGAAETTPLLCAGLIGYRSLRLAGEARRLGIYGFGSAAHLVTQLAVAEGHEIYAFTTPGDTAAQRFARETGAAWAGGSDEPAPQPLDAAVIFAPVGALVPKALRDVKKGAAVVCGGIHMSDIPGFPYADLWGERQLRSVANLTREDARAFFAAVGRTPVRARVRVYPLGLANEALADLRHGAFNGTAVLDCSGA